MDLGVWLRSLGLERYEAVFRKNEIDDTVLPNLTAEDLKELGIGALGHRRKLLDAIALLRSETTARSPPPEAPPAHSRPLQDTAERRQVTVMFSDLVGSTALSARMDPEDLRQVISAYQKCVSQVVQRFGGFVAKFLGDVGVSALAPALLPIQPDRRRRPSQWQCPLGFAVERWTSARQPLGPTPAPPVPRARRRPRVLAGSRNRPAPRWLTQGSSSSAALESRTYLKIADGRRSSISVR
jgi:hypothetical protein